MYNKKEREEYSEYRSRICATLGITENEYNAYRRIGQKLHKIYEDNCNGTYSWTDTEYDTQTEPHERKAEKLAEKHGLYVYFQTDPRGATIYIDTKPIPSNNYTQATCIY